MILGMTMAAALALNGKEIPSAKEVIEPSFRKLWSSQHVGLIYQGVGRAEARQVFSWGVLQTQLGRCEKVTSAADLKFWRGYMRTSRTRSVPLLRKMISYGDATFAQGRAEGIGELSPAACSVTIASLILKVKRDD